MGKGNLWVPLVFLFFSFTSILLVGFVIVGVINDDEKLSRCEVLCRLSDWNSFVIFWESRELDLELTLVNENNQGSDFAGLVLSNLYDSEASSEWVEWIALKEIDWDLFGCRFMDARCKGRVWDETSILSRCVLFELWNRKLFWSCVVVMKVLL